MHLFSFLCTIILSVESYNYRSIYDPRVNNDSMHNNIYLFNLITDHAHQESCIPLPSISQQELQRHDYDHTNQAPVNNDLMFLEGFADTYIPLLNTSLNNDHSYVNYSNNQPFHPHMHPDQYSHPEDHHEETYSLTNLQTKTEMLEGKSK